MPSERINRVTHRYARISFQRYSKYCMRNLIYISVSQCYFALCAASSPRRYRVKQIARTIYSFMLQPYDIWIKGIRSIRICNTDLAQCTWPLRRPGEDSESRGQIQNIFFVCCRNRTVSLHLSTDDPERSFYTSWLLKESKK